MQIAYVIHAYHRPQQLGRLLRALNSENCHFYIHIDSRVDQSEFVKAADGIANISWVKREPSAWGTIWCVKAVVNALTEALQSTVIPEYFYLLSGQDYPIRPTPEIEQTLTQNRHCDYLTFSPLPIPRWPAGGFKRFSRYHLVVSRNPVIRKSAEFMGLFLPRRKLPYDLKPFGGEFYMGLTRKTIEYVMSFLDRFPDYLAFFRYSYVPEEMFFQTILLNSTDPEIKNGLVNQTLTYIDWNRPNGPFPAILTSKDFETLRHCGKLFARKFDPHIDPRVFDLIDLELRTT